MEDTQGEQTALLDMIDGDILKEDVAYHIVVTGNDSHTTLVVYLAFTLVEDADATENKIFDGVNAGSVVAFGRSSVQTNEDRVCNLGIEHTIFDEDMSGGPHITFAGSIDGKTVIAGFTVATADSDVRGRKYIESVAPRSVGIALHILNEHRVTGTCRHLRGDKISHNDISAVAYLYAIPPLSGTQGSAVAINDHIAAVMYLYLTGIVFMGIQDNRIAGMHLDGS